MASVKRNIHFFKLRTKSDDPDVQFSIAEAIQNVEVISFAEPAAQPTSRYMETGHAGLVLGMWRTRGVDPIKVMIGGVRSNRLPSIDDHGNVTPLDIGDKSLVEFTHCVFFSSGIVGVEFNFYGPRATRLSDYFAEKCPNQPPVALDAIVNRDAAKMFGQMEDIRLFHFRAFAEKLPEETLNSDGLLSFLGDMAAQTGADVIEVILRPKLHTQETLGQNVVNIISDLIGWPHTREVADIFKRNDILFKPSGGRVN